MPTPNTRALRRGLFAVASAMAISAAATGAAAQERDKALTFEATYIADLAGPIAGTPSRTATFLDNLDLLADLNLEKAVGWRGATLHAYVLNNGGGIPNDAVGTLQGVDNIEVSDQKLRLFELWLEQGFAGGDASIRAGLYNLNSEFYVNDSAGLLIAPPFGIGSELAATGPNGPSIFPSTALGVRAMRTFEGGAYIRAAALNAKSGVIGDPGGVDLSFDDGALLIAEAGIEGPARIGIGAWSYTDDQDDIRDLDALGNPVKRTGWGAYLLGEHILFGDDDSRAATAFFRVGVSDGDTTPFTGGWQAGLRMAGVFAGRPDSEFSVGVHQGRLNDKFKANLTDAGTLPADAETGIELTYSDRIAPRVTVQPDLQWINGAGGDDRTSDRWVAVLRVKIDLTPGS